MNIFELKLKFNDQVSSIDLDFIISFVIKKSREFILANPNFLINKLGLEKIYKLIDLRKKNYPIAYLTNQKEFYGINFYVNKDVLVPRPETELIIDAAIEKITKNTKPTMVIDVGTGSGCIITTLAKLIPNSKIQNLSSATIEDPKFYGIDISKEALNVAKKNAKLNNVGENIKFLQGNLLEPVAKFILKNPKSKIQILANLPYLTPTQVKASPSIEQEPRLALVAGPDGLKYYRKLFKQIKKLSLDDYNIFCEIDHTQTSNIKTLIKKELPQDEFEIKKDLSGFDRLVIITKKHSD